MSSSNSWLRGQRKTELVELAENVGLQKYVAFCPTCSFVGSRARNAPRRSD